MTTFATTRLHSPNARRLARALTCHRNTLRPHGSLGVRPTPSKHEAAFCGSDGRWRSRPHRASHHNEGNAQACRATRRRTQETTPPPLCVQWHAVRSKQRARPKRRFTAQCPRNGKQRRDINRIRRLTCPLDNLAYQSTWRRIHPRPSRDLPLNASAGTIVWGEGCSIAWRSSHLLNGPSSSDTARRRRSSSDQLGSMRSAVRTRAAGHAAGSPAEAREELRCRGLSPRRAAAPTSNRPSPTTSNSKRTTSMYPEMPKGSAARSRRQAHSPSLTPSGPARLHPAPANAPQPESESEPCRRRDVDTAQPALAMRRPTKRHGHPQVQAQGCDGHRETHERGAGSDSGLGSCSPSRGALKFQSPAATATTMTGASIAASLRAAVRPKLWTPTRQRALSRSPNGCTPQPHDRPQPH